MAKAKKYRQKNIEKLARNYVDQTEINEGNEKTKSENIVAQSSKHQKELEAQQEMQKLYLKKDLTKTLIYVVISLIVITSVYFITRR